MPFQASGSAFDVLHIGNPVPLTPGQSISFAFTVERRRAPAQQRGLHVLKRVDADDRVEAPLDKAGDDRHDAATGADVEVRRLCAEHVLAHARRVLDAYLERSRRTGGPHAAVLGAERAGACPGRDLRGLRLPVEREGDVAAMAASVDEHDGLLVSV